MYISTNPAIPERSVLLMNNDKTFDSLIREALSEGEDRAELNPALIPQVKSRLSSQKGRYKTNMNKINNIFGTRFGKVAGVCCCMTLVLALSFTFIQPVRAIGEKGIDKIRFMVYDVVKGNDGKYITVKVPYEEPKKTGSSMTAIPSGEFKKITGLLSKIPKTLAGGYTFDHKGVGGYDPESHSMIMLSLQDNTPEKLPDRLQEIVSSFYSRGKSQIVLNMSYFDAPFALNMKHELIEGDNKKNLTIGGITATYAEYPGVRYPLREDNEDRTQKPDISVLHTVKWKQNGVYFTVYDFNGDLSLEDLKAAAATVIKNMK